MKISDFIEMEPNEFSQLNNKKEVLNEMTKWANARLMWLSKQNLPSQAFHSRAITDDEGNVIRNENGNFEYRPFSYEGEDKNRFKFLKMFLSNRTSTVTGHKAAIREMANRFAEKTAEERVLNPITGKTRSSRAMLKERIRNMTYEQSKSFWSAYNKLVEANPAVIIPEKEKGANISQYIGTGDEQAEIVDFMFNNDIWDSDRIYQIFQAKVDNHYEENAMSVKHPEIHGRRSFSMGYSNLDDSIR